MNYADSTVFVVDDDDALRHSLRELVTSFELRCETHASGPEFVAAYERDRAGCLLLDLRMPQVSGLAVQRHLNELGALLPIVFLSAHGDTSSVVRAMKNGAVDFLSKPFRDDELWEAIETALRRDAQRRQAWREHEATWQQLSTLTPNERVVLKLLMQGLSNRSIADRLDLSLRTIEMRRAATFRKLKCVHLTELFAKIYRAGAHDADGERILSTAHRPHWRRSAVMSGA